jgi:hypothetical protein
MIKKRSAIVITLIFVVLLLPFITSDNAAAENSD